MSLLDGVSQCWRLSESCVVNWDAWAAVGTLSAVLVALVLARLQSRKELRTQRSKARWVALELRIALAAWHRSVVNANSRDDVDLYFLMGNEDLDPTMVPAEIVAFSESLHVLGDDAAPVADAIWVARQISNIPIEKSLRGDIGDQVEKQRIESEFRAGLLAMERYIAKAVNRINRIAGPAADPEMLRILSRW